MRSCVYTMAGWSNMRQRRRSSAIRRVRKPPHFLKESYSGNVLLALKCRSFDTPMRGVFKPGYNGSGCSDVHSGIPIGIHDHVAACTGKLETRAKPTMPTPMAGLRGISRINQDDRHASRLRLVRHELPQLVKRPTVVMVALSFADFRALSDAIQILQGNLSLCGCCGRDELLTDPVVDRSHVTCLSAGEPFQKPFGFFRAFALKRTSDFGIAGTEP